MVISLSKIADSSIRLCSESRREYLGASGIGGICERNVWYGYHVGEKPPIEPKKQRTLDIGKQLEAIVLSALEASGLDIQRPSKDNAFLEFRDKELTQFQGHADGLLFYLDKDYILEIKTAKDSSFRIFEKKGLRMWYPVYYAQVQAYMGMSGIHQAFVIAINKDTSELHDEMVRFDRKYYETLCARAKKIIESPEEPPPKISTSPIYFQCRLCDYRKVCHGNVPT